MRTAFLGAYGFGNLGDELCALDAIRHFPASERHLFSVSPDYTKRSVPMADGFFETQRGFRALKPEQVVFGGGGIGTPTALTEYTPWLRWAQKRGAATHIHNVAISSANPSEWMTAETREMLAALTSLSVRDHKSAEFIMRWGIGRLPRVTHFPEHNLPSDTSLADAVLPEGRLVGVSILATEQMRRALTDNEPLVRGILAEFKGAQIVPIVSHWHYKPGYSDDAAGFTWFRDRFLGEFEIVLPQMLDRDWWLSELTSLKLKGLIARLDTLISQRKHNLVHSIGSGVRSIGLHPATDDSLPRTFASLADQLPHGSYAVPLMRSEP